jgi:hypothetical protein
MNILDQFRNDQAAIENTGCTLQELNDVLSYLLCRKTNVKGVGHYYINNKGWDSTFTTSYTRKAKYPVADFLKAIEQEKIQQWENSKIQEKFDKVENELRAQNAIKETLDMLEKDMQEDQNSFEDLPLKISISQHGIKYYVKTKSSDINIFQMKDLLISILKGSGWQNSSIKEIFRDEK